MASAIDLTAAIGLLGGAGLGGYKLRRFLGPPLRPLTRRFEAWSAAYDVESGKGGASLRTRMVIEVVGLTLQLDSRNRQSWGARAMGIRRRDALTGGPVTLRGALIRRGVLQAVGAGMRPLVRRAVARSSERARALQPQVEELRRVHADDKAAQQQAVISFYREHNVNPARSCLSALLMPLTLSLPVLFTRRHQSVPDRLAGIVWVVEEPRKTGRLRRRAQPCR